MRSLEVCQSGRLGFTANEEDVKVPQVRILSLPLKERICLETL